MSDKRTGKKKKKLRPKVTEEVSGAILDAPIIQTAKTKKPTKG
jgi:hypothetical protein